MIFFLGLIIGPGLNFPKGFVDCCGLTLLFSAAPTLFSVTDMAILSCFQDFFYRLNAKAKGHSGLFAAFLLSALR